MAFHPVKAIRVCKETLAKPGKHLSGLKAFLWEMGNNREIIGTHKILASSKYCWPCIFGKNNDHIKCLTVFYYA